MQKKKKKVAIVGLRMWLSQDYISICCLKKDEEILNIISQGNANQKHREIPAAYPLGWLEVKGIR